MKRNSLIGVIISAVLFLGGGESFGQQNNNYEPLYVSLGDEFILHQNQSAIIINEDIEIKIIQFHNSPCPENVKCVWSGIGITFEYYHNKEVKRGINLVQAFGYQTTILETDHETYAKLKVNKINVKERP
jgi:hypothetical protein